MIVQSKRYKYIKYILGLAKHNVTTLQYTAVFITLVNH